MRALDFFLDLDLQERRERDEIEKKGEGGDKV
jgi:hypothetical protein